MRKDESSRTARSPCSWHKHLPKDDKRRVNKSNRDRVKIQIKKDGVDTPDQK